LLGGGHNHNDDASPNLITPKSARGEGKKKLSRSNSKQSTRKMPLMSKPTITAQAFEDEPIVEYEPPTLFVQKWVDYSAKYGVGFMLTDQSTGVYFNDASKIVSGVMDPKTFQLIKREKDESGKKVDTKQTFTLDYYPPEHAKKVDLF
jgi:hypothetical protein